MRISATMSFLGNTFHLKFQHFKTPIAPTLGLSARIPHSTDYTVFLDFDNIVDESLVDRLIYLQERYTLGDFHILKTNQFGRHVICIDRLPLRQALEVVEDSNCDYLFQKGIRLNEYRSWILRIAEKGNRPKPKYLYTVPSPHNGRNLQFEALGLFLKHYYGAKVRMPNPDGVYELEVQRYKTGSKLDVRRLRKIAEAKHC